MPSVPNIFTCCFNPRVREPSGHTAVDSNALPWPQIDPDAPDSAPQPLFAPHRRKPLPTEMGFYPDAQPPLKRQHAVDEHGKKIERSMPMLLVSQTGERYLRSPRLASGSYGKVYAVVRERDGQAFAAKVFRKPDRQDISHKVNGSAKDKVRHTSVSLDKTIRNEQAIATHVNAYTAPIDTGWGMGRHFFILPLMAADMDVLLTHASRIPTSLRMDARRAQALSLLAWGSAELAQMHMRGYIHRDVKPGNLLVAPDGSVRLGDYGLAKRCAPGTTHCHGYAGTPDYMAPEFFQNDLATPQTDIYSLGLSVAEVAAGEHPYNIVRASTDTYSANDSAADIFNHWLGTLPRVMAEEMSSEQRLAAFPRATAAQLDALDTWLVDMEAALGPGTTKVVLAELLARDPAQRPRAMPLSLAFEAHRDPASQAHRNIQAQLPQLQQQTQVPSRVADLTTSWNMLRAWGLT